MDKKNTYIVIFLADIAESPKSTAKAELSRTVSKYIDDGLLTAIEAYSEFYPPLNNIKKKYGDSDTRRTWRSKENVDAAFVMCYCKDLSQYYIHLEDDMISSPSFFPKLENFIETQSVKPWLMIDAAIKCSKAKVFPTEHVENFASYIYVLYDESPIDWLMNGWRKLKGHGEIRSPSASLFQHIGDQSSLAEKGFSENLQREPFFDQYDQKYRGRNPPASVISSMSSNEGKPQDAYEKGIGYFWAINPRKDDYVLIKFNAPTVVRKVFIDTGSYHSRQDVLRSGDLEASFESTAGEVKPSNISNHCGEFKFLGAFNKGKVESSVGESRSVICLRITVLQNQREWLYIREIDVW